MDMTAFAATAVAQNLDPTVNVTRAYEGKLLEVDKPSFRMDVPDSVTRFNLDFDYSVMSNPYKGGNEFNPYLQDIRPERIDDKESSLWLRAGAGYDNIDLEAATAHNVVAMNTPGQNSNAVAELALGLMVFAVRNFYNGTSGTELMGKKLGIHAFGNVGRNVARIAKGFGMDVYAYDAYCPDEAMVAAGVTPVHSAEELYAGCDVVSLHIPATPETKGSIGRRLVGSMPKGAMLVNTARKEVINEEELIALMQERTDLKYITDIMPAADQKFQELFEGRYFSTPKKMGAQTAEANINAGIAAAKQIVDFFVNGNTRFRVN